MRPVGAMASWSGDYRFQLGDALLVAPLLDDMGRRDVALPAGVRWYDWWNPAGDALAGGQTLAQYDATDLARIPLFVREGAIVPAEVANDVTGLGDAASSGALTLLVYPGAAASRFVLTEQDDSTTEVGCSASGTSAQVTLARAVRTTVLRVRRDGVTSAVSVNGAALTGQSDRAAFDAASTGWWVDTAHRWVWVKLAPSAGAVTVSLTGGA
jgi:alpha-D-xyloside xylohydrolase